MPIFLLVCLLFFQLLIYLSSRFILLSLLHILFFLLLPLHSIRSYCDFSLFTLYKCIQARLFCLHRKSAGKGIIRSPSRYLMLFTYVCHNVTYLKILHPCHWQVSLDPRRGYGDQAAVLHGKGPIQTVASNVVARYVRNFKVPLNMNELQRLRFLKFRKRQHFFWKFLKLKRPHWIWKFSNCLRRRFCLCCFSVELQKTRLLISFLYC